MERAVDSSLSTVALIVGLIYAAVATFGLIFPEKFCEFWRRFHRKDILGCVLIMIDTLWFMYWAWTDQTAEFQPYKQYFCWGVFAIGLGTCFFVRDLIAVRGLWIFKLLAARVLLDVAFLWETQTRLVLTMLAYVWIILGIWFTISPWRYRDLMNALCAGANRCRALCGIMLLLAFLLIAFSFTTYRIQAAP